MSDSAAKCPHCQQPATHTFLRESYCALHQEMEKNIHRFLYAPDNGVVNVDGTYKVDLPPEAFKDERVMKRAEELKPLVAERKAAAAKLRPPTREAKIEEYVERLMAETDEEGRVKILHEVERVESRALTQRVFEEWGVAQDKALGALSLPTPPIEVFWQKLSSKTGHPRVVLKTTLFRIAFQYDTVNAYAQGFLEAAYAAIRDLVLQGGLSPDSYVLKASSIIERELHRVGSPLVQPAPDAEPPEVPMSNTESLMSRVLQGAKEDAVDAAYRAGANQMVKAVKGPLLKGLATRISGSSREKNRTMAMVEAFLDTEAGAGLLAGLIGLAMTMVPTKNDHVDLLAKELRVKSSTVVIDMLADVLLDPVRNALEGVIAGLPAAIDQVRVDTSENKPVESKTIEERRADLKARMAALEAEAAAAEESVRTAMKATF